MRISFYFFLNHFGYPEFEKHTLLILHLMENTSQELKILSIDIGGTNVKATVLDQNGKLLQAYKKVKTPDPATPEKLLEAINLLLKGFMSYDKVSVGFPGYVKGGIIFTAPNLDTKLWKNVDLRKLIGDSLKKPVRLVNDSDMQGLGVVSGKGLELVITLGTGFGSALLLNGHLLPHLEIAQHPFTKNKTYDTYIGDEALNDKGLVKWNKRMERVLKVLKTVFNYDRLYIGGGNADKLNFKLDDNITIISNKEGIKGGARLWKDDDIM